MSAMAMISGWFSPVVGTLAMRDGPVAGLGLIDTILARGDLGGTTWRTRRGWTCRHGSVQLDNGRRIGAPQHVVESDVVAPPQPGAAALWTNLYGLELVQKSVLMSG